MAMGKCYIDETAGWMPPAFAGLMENGGCRLRGTHPMQEILLYGFNLEALSVAV